MKKTRHVSILKNAVNLGKALAFVLLLGVMSMSSAFAQNCSVNAGGNATICGTSYTLQGSSSNNVSGAPTWSVASTPSGAPTPTISDVHSYTPTVTGMTKPGQYDFMITETCTAGGSVSSHVIITSSGDVSSFTAGPDITNVPATTGTAILNATIPEGFTASWTYYSIYNYEYYSSIVTTNATMTGTTTATPTLTLTNKAVPTTDPAYAAVLTITSIYNSNCTYTDTAIVRFIPSPNLVFPTTTSKCLSSTPALDMFIVPNSGSPIFSTNTPNSAGNPTWGTTVTMNVISQPSGGNITYDRIQEGWLYFTGATTQGTYTFTLTISNTTGTYTTPTLTFTNTGTLPNFVNFVDASYPDQMQLYSWNGSGGIVYCNKAGNTDPITFYFKVDPADPVTTTTSVNTEGIIPTGGAPTLSAVTGAGTSRDRSVTLTPPSGGWHVGTYAIHLNVSNGGCSLSQDFYVHISDGNRTAVSVPDTLVCYPGSGTVSVTVPLPQVYKGVVDPSYFQDFNGGYELSLVSGPSGAAAPTFDASNLRTMTNTSTTIGNLNTAGDYVFQIAAAPLGGGVGQFLDKEYACSGTSMSSTFTVHVSTQVNANAGSDQTINSSTATATLAGNNPGTGASGVWTLSSAPSGTTPSISSPNTYTTNVSNFDAAGTYDFAWTITTQSNGCVSTDHVQLVRPYALPVDYALPLVGSQQAQYIVLTWTTGTEINNKGFDVQHSLDGKTYTSLGFVGTKVNNGTGSGTNYSFTDKNPALGMANYYRLVQTDQDGRTALSNVAMVNTSNASGVKLFPNPAYGSISVSGITAGSSLSIVSMDGRTIKIVSATASTQQIDLTGLTSGVYILKVHKNGQADSSLKFIVK